MMIQISADPFSGQPIISVFSDHCTVITEAANQSPHNDVVRGPTLPAAPVRRRSGSLFGMGVVAVVAVLVGASFSAYRSSNAASPNGVAEAARTSPGSLAANEPRHQAPPELQGQRVEEALTGRPVITQPPIAPAKGGGNPFGLE